MGGDQMRPNIHIDDMVRCYMHVLEQPSAKINGKTFNAGYHNHTVMNLGQMVAKVVGKTRPVELVIEPTNDNRSYHISSAKIEKELGFTALYTIEDAVEGLVQAFQAGSLPDSLTDDRYYNIKTMKTVNLA